MGLGRLIGSGDADSETCLRLVDRLEVPVQSSAWFELFKKVLIANRGAIACRVIRTCRRLGVETVAVYSPAEGSPLHAELADEAVALLETVSPVVGYLDIGAVIGAAVGTGADAVHPGYGFLSENPAFAQVCEEAGVVFIGPSAETVRTVGNKREARRRLAE